MSRLWAGIGMLALGITACSGNAKNLPQDTAAITSEAGGDAPTNDPVSDRDRHPERSLESGARIDATIDNALTSRTDKVGETLQATISNDIKDNAGNVVIPSGSTAMLRISQLEPGSDQGPADGALSLIVSSITVNAQEYPVTATLDPVAHHMEGRGVTTDEAAKIGAGTVIGAVAGHLIGKDNKGTVIGGAVGAVAGTAVAVHYAVRDVVVSAGTPIAFTLSRSLRVSPR